MRLKHLPVFIALAWLAGCARRPPAEPARHQCQPTPNGLVECWEVGPEAPAPR